MLNIYKGIKPGSKYLLPLALSMCAGTAESAATATGTIIEYEGNSKAAGYEHDSTASEHYEDDSSALSASITLEEAKAIALACAGISSANFTDAKLDTDDGRVVYKLEFDTNNMKYECKVDANTGEIFKWEEKAD